MRTNRIKNFRRVEYYHCICRCVGLQNLLEVGRVKNVLQEMLWRSADFSGVQVITYCIMDDHFHLLVRVPARDSEISEEELLRRYKCLYESTPIRVLEFTRQLKERSIRCELKVDPDPMIEEIVKHLKARMHDISQFMKTLKQRFTQWYNKSHGRVGTLWTERFKSLIVEDNPDLLATIAAYIEMNPVRARICDKAQDYKWCGIRDFLDKQGIYSTSSVAGDACRDESRITYGHEFYRYAILPLIEEAQIELTTEKAMELEAAKKAINSNRKETLEAMRIPMKMLLMGRLKHLSEGLAIGSILFLQTMASLGSGAGYGRVSINTGFQVDEELRLMCLRRIRGPKIE